MKILHTNFYSDPHQGRTHPSTAFAFRNHCDYACPVEIYRPSSSNRWKWALLIIAVIVFLLEIA